MKKTLREILEATVEDSRFKTFWFESQINEEEDLSLDYYYSNPDYSPNGRNWI